MKAVRDAFEAARLGDRDLDEALAVVETFLAANADHAVAMAYLGGLHAMKAGEAALPWIKMKHVNAASALLDTAHRRRSDPPSDAAQTHPPDLEILLLRGVAYANFPAFLGRAETARECLETARDHAAFLTVPSHYRALAYAHLAVLSHRSRQEASAHQLLEQALIADAATAYRIWTTR